MWLWPIREGVENTLANMASYSDAARNLGSKEQQT